MFCALPVLCVCAAARAEVCVVTTGDSLTVGYGLQRLQSAFDAAEYDATVYTVASPGCTSARFSGREWDSVTQSKHDFVDDILALDPDVVCFQLGTVDALYCLSDPDRFDVHLLGGAAAIDAGSSVGAPKLDRDRIPRPQGNGSDIGAYEWHAEDVLPVDESASDL